MSEISLVTYLILDLRNIPLQKHLSHCYQIILKQLEIQSNGLRILAL